MKKFRPFAFFDRTLLVLACMAGVSGAACYFLLGSDVFLESFSSDFQTFLGVAPKMAVALLVAAYIQLLVPRDVVARYLGERSGIGGVTLATGLGLATPGGPITSFPVVSALYEAGTGRAALIAYLTAWSTLGFQRLLVWDIPLLGAESTVLRQLASLPLPFLAAFISSLLPAQPPRKPPA